MSIVGPQGPDWGNWNPQTQMGGFDPNWSPNPNLAGKYQWNEGPMIDGNNQMINDGPRTWQPQQQTSISAPTSDPWAGIRPDLVQIYKQAGVQAPGAVGSGFRDAAYWNNIDPSQNARLAADLAGNGPDTPGPGDVGNTSGQNQQPNFGGGLSGNIMQLLQQITGGGNSQLQSAPLYNPHQNNQQQHLMSNNGNTAVNNANNAVSSNGTLIGTSMSAPSGMSQGGFNRQPLGYASNNPVGSSNGMPKPKWTPFSNNGIMNSQNTPMGAPTFFSNGNMNSASGKNNATSYTNNIY